MQKYFPHKTIKTLLKFTFKKILLYEQGHQVCVCIFSLCPLLFPSSGLKIHILGSECKNDQANFTDWMSLLSSISLKKSALIHRLSAIIPKTIHQDGIAEKKKNLDCLELILKPSQHIISINVINCNKNYACKIVWLDMIYVSLGPFNITANFPWLKSLQIKKKIKLKLSKINQEEEWYVMSDHEN